MSKDVTQVNLSKKISQTKVCKLQIATILTLICQNWLNFFFACFDCCQFSNLALFCKRTTLYKAKKCSWNPDKSKRVPFHVFLLNFNNTIIMRYYPCLCALQCYPFCFWCYNYSDSVVNLLNVIDSNPEQSSSNLSSTTLKVIRTTQIKLAAKSFIIDDHGSVSPMSVKSS